MSTTKGALVLGCVKEVYDYHLLVKLPNGITGNVSIKAIGDGYTQLLQSLVDGNATPDEDVASLKDLFFIGQIVRCCIVDTPENQKRNNRKCEVSLNPRLVNQFVPRHLLTSQFVLHAVVHSVEDHGYLLDLGQYSSSNDNQFVFLSENDALPLKKQLLQVLPHSHTDENCQRLKIGQIVPCIVNKEKTKEGSNRMLKAICQTHTLYKTVLTEENTKSLHFGLIVPGMWIQVSSSSSQSKVNSETNKKQKTIKDKKDNFMKCHFNDLTFLFRQSHMDSTKEKSDNKSQIVCVLNVNPTSKKVHVSSLPNLLPPRDISKASGPIPTSIHDEIKSLITQTFADCTVIQQTNHCLYLSLPDPHKVTAIVDKSKVSDKTEIVTNFKEKFPVGSKVTCRIADYDPLMGLALGTMKKKDLEMPFLQLMDIKGGEIIQATVMKHSAQGFVCSVVNGRVTALLTYLHALEGSLLSQNPPKSSSSLSKKSKSSFKSKKSQIEILKEKYTVGKKIRCRILIIDQNQRKVLLTAKKKLLKCNLPPVIDYNQLHNGLMASGFVADISQNGLVIVFYNNIKGFLHKSKLGIDDSEDVEQLFYRGQVLQVKVVNWNPQTKKLSLSLPVSNNSLKKIKESLDQFEIGKTYWATITRRSQDGFQVTLSLTKEEKKSQENDVKKSFVTAFLPFGHLTDCAAHVDLLPDCYKVGQMFDKPLIVIHKENRLTVSAKPSLYKNNNENSVLDELSGGALEVGHQYKCWIRTVSPPHGIFVDFGCNLRGLAPVRLLSAPFASIVTYGYFSPNETVEAKIVEVVEQNDGKKRSLVSLRLQDVADAYNKNSLLYINDILTNYLLEYQKICQNKAATKKMPAIGSVIQMQIIQYCNDVGLTGKITIGKKEFHCIANAHNVEPHLKMITNGESLDASQTVDAVVLYYDISNDCLEVTLDPWLVNVISQRTEDSGSAVSVDQLIDSSVLLIKPQFILVALKGHAVGKLAFLPTKKHWNDVITVNHYAIDQKNRVVIKKILDDGSILANLQIHEPLTRGKKRLSTQQLENSKMIRVQCGDVVKVEITAVLATQLNVVIQNTGNKPRRGRILISEVYPSSLVSKVKNGQQILTDNFKVGQVLDAFVVKEREGTREKEISPLSGFNLLELSLKKIENKTTKKEVLFYSGKDKNGNYYFITNSTGESTMCPLLNLGSTEKEISNLQNLLVKPGVVVVK